MKGEVVSIHNRYGKYRHSSTHS